MRNWFTRWRGAACELAFGAVLALLGSGAQADGHDLVVLSKHRDLASAVGVKLFIRRGDVDEMDAKARIPRGWIGPGVVGGNALVVANNLKIDDDKQAHLGTPAFMQQVLDAYRSDGSEALYEYRLSRSGSLSAGKLAVANVAKSASGPHLAEEVTTVRSNCLANASLKYQRDCDCLVAKFRRDRPADPVRGYTAVFDDIVRSGACPNAEGIRTVETERCLMARKHLSEADRSRVCSCIVEGMVERFGRDRGAQNTGQYQKAWGDLVKSCR